jgi:hypothetical protein
LSARGPLTTAANQMQNNAPGKRIEMIRPTQWPARRPIMRPKLFVLFGLFFAVLLWGEGYKLSLYFDQKAPSSRIPVAKLWIESRTAFATTAPRCKSKPNLVRVSQPFPVTVQPTGYRGCAAPFMIPVCRRGVTYFDFHLPSRSPPPHRFFSA